MYYFIGIVWFFLSFIGTQTAFSESDFWQEKSNGLYGGGVPHLAINSAGYIFAGTSSGMFRSTDNGETWTPINNGLEGQTICDLVISHSGKIFVITYWWSGSGVRYGVFRSTDNGESWIQTNLSPSFESQKYYYAIETLALNSSGDIFAYCIGGKVFRSIDDGETWIEMSSAFRGLTFIPVMVINPSGDIFIKKIEPGTSEQSILRSTDNGATWVEVNTSDLNLIYLSNGSQNLVSLAVSPQGEIYATTAFSDKGNIYKSTDNGETWVRLENSPSNVSINCLAFTSSGLILAGAQAPADRLNESGVYFSRDNGNTWENSCLGNTGVISLAVNASGHVFAGTVGAGILRNTDILGNWEYLTNGLGDANVRWLAMDSSDRIFAGAQNGVFCSIDNGKNWANVGLVDESIWVISVDALGTIFAGTADGDIFRSLDHGDNWSKVGAGLSDYIYALSFNTSNDVFAGTPSGIFRSTDGGENWTLVNNGLTDTNVYTLSINSSGVIFAGVLNAGIFRSTDNGETWIQVNNGLTDFFITSLLAESSGKVFAGTLQNGIFCSLDNGETWNKLDASGSWNIPVYSLVINASGVLYAGIGNPDTGGGVYGSSDNGNTWTSYGPNYGVGSLAINSFNQIFAGVWDMGVATCNNLTSYVWERVNNGLRAVNICSLAIDSSDNIFVGTGGYGSSEGSGVFRSTDHGENWVNTGLENEVVWSIAFNSSGHVFAGSKDIYRSTDKGEHWIKMIDGLNGVIDLDINISGDIFAVTRRAIFRSTDNGESWSKVYTLPEEWLQGFPCLSISPSGGIFAGGMGIIRSTDNGESWAPVNTVNNVSTSLNFGLKYTKITSIVINSSGYIFAGAYPATNGPYYGPFYRSIDNGESWTPFSNGLQEGDSISSLAINSYGYIFAGSPFSGVYMSTDNGETWEGINSGLKKTEVCALAVDSHDYLYAGGSSIGFDQTESGENSMWAGKVAVSGVFRSAFPTTDIQLSISEAVPVPFSLSPNYPNPFNPVTTISFSVMQATHVKLSIYNILGQQVKTLVDEVKPAGTYAVTWNGVTDSGEKATSGVYVCRMKAGNFEKTRKLLMVK